MTHCTKSNHRIADECPPQRSRKSWWVILERVTWMSFLFTKLCNISFQINVFVLYIWLKWTFSYAIIVFFSDRLEKGRIYKCSYGVCWYDESISQNSKKKKHTCLNIIWNFLWYLLIFPGTVRLTPNIAKNGNATKSSVHRWGGHPASNANDGNLDTNVNTCALTGPSAPSWWQVDLLDVFEIHRVALTVASQYCEWQRNNYFPIFPIWLVEH